VVLELFVCFLLASVAAALFVLLEAGYFVPDVLLAAGF
jgi:hypothetical protein